MLTVAALSLAHPSDHTVGVRYHGARSNIPTFVQQKDVLLQVWFQNRRMKDKRQRMAMAWPYMPDPLLAAYMMNMMNAASLFRFFCRCTHLTYRHYRRWRAADNCRGNATAIAVLLRGAARNAREQQVKVCWRIRLLDNNASIIRKRDHEACSGNGTDADEVPVKRERATPDNQSDE